MCIYTSSLHETDEYCTLLFQSLTSWAWNLVVVPAISNSTLYENFQYTIIVTMKFNLIHFCACAYTSITIICSIVYTGPSLRHDDSNSSRFLWQTGSPGGPPVMKSSRVCHPGDSMLDHHPLQCIRHRCEYLLDLPTERLGEACPPGGLRSCVPVRALYVEFCQLCSSTHLHYSRDHVV